jgi:hypothetical protein
MTDTTTITVRLSNELKGKLERLAASTRRSILPRGRGDRGVRRPECVAGRGDREGGREGRRWRPIRARRGCQPLSRLACPGGEPQAAEDFQATLITHEIRWLEDALADITEIHGYVAADNPRAAARVVERIQAAGQGRVS